MLCITRIPILLPGIITGPTLQSSVQVSTVPAIVGGVVGALFIGVVVALLAVILCGCSARQRMGKTKCDPKVCFGI